METASAALGVACCAWRPTSPLRHFWYSVRLLSQTCRLRCFHSLHYCHSARSEPCLLPLMLVTVYRPTFPLGTTYARGVPYYFPVVFAVKSTLGFLLLLLPAATVGIVWRKPDAGAIPDTVRPHWRVLMIGFFVFLTVCLL